MSSFANGLSGSEAQMRAANLAQCTSIKVVGFVCTAKAAINANDMPTADIIEKIELMVGGELAGTKIAAWGLAFKAGTDDTRQSPAIRILMELASKGAEVHAYDPAAKRVPSVIVRHDNPRSV